MVYDLEEIGTSSLIRYASVLYCQIEKAHRRRRWLAPTFQIGD
jgi:hypothetical protein